MDAAFSASELAGTLGFELSAFVLAGWFPIQLLKTAALSSPNYVCCFATPSLQSTCSSYINRLVMSRFHFGYHLI